MSVDVLLFPIQFLSRAVEGLMMFFMADDNVITTVIVLFTFWLWYIDDRKYSLPKRKKDIDGHALLKDNITFIVKTIVPVLVVITLFKYSGLPQVYLFPIISIVIMLPWVVGLIRHKVKRRKEVSE